MKIAERLSTLFFLLVILYAVTKNIGVLVDCSKNKGYVVRDLVSIKCIQDE